MESTLSKYANKMIIVIICASFLIVVVGAVILRSMLALELGLGVVMACGLNIAKVLMLKHAVNRATTMEHGASAYTGGMYLLRFLLTGAVLVAAYFLSGDDPRVVFFGAAIGLLGMPVASYTLRFFIKDEVPGAATVVEAEAEGITESNQGNDDDTKDE